MMHLVYSQCVVVRIQNTLLQPTLKSLRIRRRRNTGSDRDLVAANQINANASVLSDLDVNFAVKVQSTALKSFLCEKRFLLYSRLALAWFLLNPEIGRAHV